jgi:hypothetical protein
VIKTSSRRDIGIYIKTSTVVGPLNLILGLLPALLMTNSQFNTYLIYAVALNFIFSGFMHLFKLVYKFPEVIFQMVFVNFIAIGMIFLILKLFSVIFINDLIFDLFLIRIIFFTTFQMVQITYVAKLSPKKFQKTALVTTGLIFTFVTLCYYADVLTIHYLLGIEALVYASFTCIGGVSIWRNRQNCDYLILWKILKTKNSLGLFFSGILGAIKMNLLFFLLATTDSEDTKTIYLVKYALDFFHNFSSNTFIKLYPHFLSKKQFNSLKLYSLNIGIRVIYILVILICITLFTNFSALLNNLFIYVFILDFIFITSLFTIVNFQIFSRLENFFLSKVDIFRIIVLLASAVVLLEFSPSEIIYINQIGNLTVFVIFVFYIKSINKA